MGHALVLQCGDAEGQDDRDTRGEHGAQYSAMVYCAPECGSKIQRDAGKKENGFVGASEEMHRETETEPEAVAQARLLSESR